MRKILCKLTAVAVFWATASMLAFGQVSSTAPLSGTVLDPNGAVVANASVTVRSQETGTEYTATTNDVGVFTVPALKAGLYTVRVSAEGFKQAVARDVKVDAATPTSINLALEIGARTEEVVIEASGELLQTQTANVSTTITGRQITELPFASRDALDLVLFLPGTATPGRPRTSTVNGLPKGSLNITMDGVNVQDNVLKSSDGFFTYIRPRIDAIDEVTVSTATPGAESAGEGAVQIKFVTRSGSNEFHGSVYEYHRNPAVNSNYYFNKFATFDSAGNYSPLPRARVLLNQFGGRVGGPIIKDRFFFFMNYEEFRLPEQTLRQRTILNPTTATGVFQYNTGSGVQSINLLQLAAAAGQTSTIDPTVGKLLTDIRATTSKGTVQQLTDPNLQRFSFINTGSQVRKFPTVRFDLNLTEKHHLENIWNYQKFDSTVDFLNGVDPAFPGFPNFGSQKSNRFSNVIALRSTLAPTLVNEFRFGITGGTVAFFPEVTPAAFANQGGVSLSLAAAGLSSPTVTTFTGKRNSPVWQYSDTVSWTKGSHNLNLGFNFTQINYYGSNFNGGVVPGVTLGLASADPAQALFTPANFPGASDADINRARGLYAVLTGRITAVSRTAYLAEDSKYQLLGPYVERARMREMGFFAQDTYRFRSNLTLNYGLRYEIQFPFRALNNNYSEVSYADLFGISGENNLFKPGSTGGRTPQFTQVTQDTKLYETDTNNFAPSVGFAWSPESKSDLARAILGNGGQTVVRGGFSLSYVREGMQYIATILGANPGGNLDASLTAGVNLAAGTLLRAGVPAAPSIPPAPTYPLTPVLTNTARAFHPNLQTGYVPSWTFGLQRELNRDTVVEVRYVGNRGIKLWRTYGLNEINIVENGFLNEFKLAQANLAANVAANRGNTFAYFGPNSGTSPLPTILGYFAGVPAAQAGDPARYTPTAVANLFRNTTFISALNPAIPNALGFASNLMTFSGTLRNNDVAAGLPRNQFLVNPDVLFGGAFLVDNSTRTWYDGMTIELRRRMSKGLLVQSSYTFSKSLTNFYASSSAGSLNFNTLRDKSRDKTFSPFDITHSFKANWLYELPFGPDRRFLNYGGALGRILGGWESHGTARLQSGTPFNFGNVQLVGMTRDDLQKAININVVGSGRTAVINYLPEDIILNTRRAFNPGSALGAPTGRYIAPANAGEPLAFGAERGNPNLVLYGPSMTRFDLSIVKKTKITERVNFEFRTEFLNAFNNINFRVNNPAADASFVGGFSSATFGQTTFAYQDLSTTNDPGGRLLQFVARINF